MVKNLSINERKLREVYLRGIATGKIYGPLTGLPEEDMIWLKNYSEEAIRSVAPNKTLFQFLYDNNKIDINCFLDKYKSKLNDSFILGYFIHLYTDLLWDKYFVSDIVNKDSILLLNGDTIENTKENYKKLIYNDYTNLNVLLLDEYNLNLSLFYNEAVIPDITMDEIPVNKLGKLLDYTGVIIANTKENKAYTFRLENIVPFINTSAHLILLKIMELTNN